MSLNLNKRPCQRHLPQPRTFSDVQKCSFTSPLSGNAIEVSAAEARVAQLAATGA
jgi:hypothetical protein